MVCTEDGLGAVAGGSLANSVGEEPLVAICELAKHWFEPTHIGNVGIAMS